MKVQILASFILFISIALGSTPTAELSSSALEETEDLEDGIPDNDLGTINDQLQPEHSVPTTGVSTTINQSESVCGRCESPNDCCSCCEIIVTVYGIAYLAALVIVLFILFPIYYFR